MTWKFLIVVVEAVELRADVAAGEVAFQPAS